MIRKKLVPIVALIIAGLVVGCSSSNSMLGNVESNIQSGNYDSARVQADRYIQQNPQSPLGYYWKGVALGQHAQDVSTKQNNPDEAHPLYEDMMDNFSTAKEKTASGETPGELERIDPFRLSLWRSEHNTGVKYATDDSLKQVTDNPLEVSLSHLKNAITVEPDSALSWGVYAQVNGMQENYGEAAKAQEKFLQLQDSADAKSYLLLAQYYRNSDQPQKAISTLEDVQNKYPEDTQVVEVLADSYSDAGQPDKAIAAVESLVKKDPNNTRYRLFLGNRIYQSAIKYQDKFETNADSILTLQQKMRNASGSEKNQIQSQINRLQEKNQQLLDKNKELTDRAVKELNVVIDNTQDNASAYNTLGIIYQNRAAILFDKRNLVTTDNKKAAELDDQAKDQLRKAMQNYEKAAEIDPNNKKYWRSLFQIYTSLGMDQKAKEAEQKAGMQ